MIWIELMNDHFFEWKDLLEIRAARVLKKASKVEDLDVAFVEGAITTERDAEKLRRIRANSKKLVAIGSCAINGMPAAQRNTFDTALQKEIDAMVRQFNQTKSVRKVKDVVRVDDEVQGCPMREEDFLSALDRYLKEFGVKNAP